MPPEQPPLGFREFLTVLWHRKRIIVGVTAVVVGTAMFYSALQTPIYESSAEVLVRPINFDPTQSPNQSGFVNMETEQRVASSSVVAENAAEALATRDITMAAISVETTENVETLTFTATSPDRESAMATAQAFAEGYLEFREEEIVDDLLAAREPIQQEIATLDQQIETVQRQLFATDADDANEAERAGLQVQLTNLLTQRASLQGKLNELITPDDIRVGEVLHDAIFPTAPSSPDHVKAGAFSLFVGLSLGIGLAFLRDRLDQRVRDRRDVETLVGLPVLGFIPPMGRASGENGAGLPAGVAGDAYRTLATTLLAGAARERWQTIAVTSATEGEGKTSVVARLSIALAEAGRKVILVSADLRRPTLHEHFSVPDRMGITDLISGKAGLHSTLRPVPRHQSLWLLASGSPLNGGAERLSSGFIQWLLNMLQRRADFVLIDSPPVLGAAEALSLTRGADATLMVIDSRKVHRATVVEARDRLVQVEARVVGTVINKHDPDEFRYGAYASAYTSFVEPVNAQARPQQGHPRRHRLRTVEPRETP